jgi:YidC/Oxa1 family membrane protein insertase
MFLAFKLSNLITVPFGWLLGQLYNLFENYGVAMIVFGVLVQLIMLPIKAKSKKSMMKMSRLQPRIQEIQRKYANDQQKQNEAMQQLQREEGASMGMGGCLWSFIPLFILFPLFTVIREPITYILGESAEVTTQIIAVIKEAAV